MKKILLFITLLSNMVIAKEVHVKMAASLYNSNKLAVTLSNDKGWHTYWKNPGDAGLPVEFHFKRNGKKITLNIDEWPVPKRYIEAGDILAYGYSNRYTFFFTLSDQEQRELKGSSLEIHGKWLVCKDICLPGEQKILLTFNRQGQIVSNDSQFKIKENELDQAQKKIPQEVSLPQGFNIYLTKLKAENKLRLHYSYKGLKPKVINNNINLLTPYLAPPLGFKQEKLFYHSQDQSYYGYIDIDWDGEYQEPPQDLPKDGSFSTPIKLPFLLQTPQGVVATKTSIANFSPETEVLTKFYQELKDQQKKPKTESSNSIFSFLLFAFLGGLILNLMPCVLPVISLKLFGLLNMKGEGDSRILKHNLAYTLGVLLTFIALALTIIALKSGGEAVGWGFQLQSPTFVFLMILIIFIMALNFFGLFEFKTPGGSSLGGKELSQTFIGDMGAGVIATILSTPCSAPFLGTALTFAFTSSPLFILLTFLSIGLGLAFPFLLTGLFPKLINFLPKPGLWMEKLKYILGFTLLLTVAWLYDVLQNLIDFETFGLFINSILVFIFFAFFARKKIFKQKWIQVLIFIIPLLMIFQLISRQGLNLYSNNQNQTKKSSSGLQWEKWSQEKMLTSQNIVFVDFTAKWCLTCKVNKKLVLETEAFKKLAHKYHLKLMVADWTKRDAKITSFLQSYQVFGVPAYFLYVPQVGTKHLGEVVSLDSLERVLQDLP